MFEGAEAGPAGGTRSGVEARLAGLRPGPVLAAALAGLDSRTLTAYDRVEVVKAHERLSSWVAASQATAIAALDAALIPGDVDPGHRDDRVTRDELAAALRLSAATGQKRLDVARALCGRLAATHAALARGEIGYWQAVAICEATAPLADAAAAAVQTRVLARSGVKSSV